ncbi:MAG: leucine-rich repeat protein, partial [Clostridia bacterium]|nr:leucine-rich repeat protein [Clostridia bacterium]
ISQAQGIAYDEQIWSAMLRSKKILVIGTRREYLESVWVQCEWRRWMYLRHIGVRSSDSFVTLIPSEDEWSYIRPREWDEQRITVYTDIDGAIEALIDTPATPSMPPQASQNRQIRDIRVLLDMDQDLQDAEERLRPLLRATPSNGELRWLSLRIKTRNFSELDKITPQEVNVANRCLKDDGYNPEDNPEYRMYTELKAAKDARLQAAKQASAQQNDSRSAAKTPPTPQRTEQSSASGMSRPQTASNSTWAAMPRTEQSAPSGTSRPQAVSHNTPSSSSGTSDSPVLGTVKRSSSYRSNRFALNEVLQILMICITAISLLASVICLFLGSRNYVYVSFACAGVSCVLWLAIFISYKKSWGFDYMYSDGWMITALGTAFVWLAAVVVGIFLIVNTYGVQDMVIKDGVLVNSYLNEKTVKVPDGITEIAEDAFGQNWQFRNKKVQTIELPDSVEIISPQAFGGCSNLKEIYIGNNVRSIGAMAFHGCIGLQTIYFRGTQAEWDAIEKTEGFLMDWNSGIKDCEIVFLGDVSGE